MSTIPRTEESEMNKKEIEALARRAVACKHWRWMPGMLDTNGDTVVMVKLTIPYVFCWDEDGQGSAASTLALPDLTDPATLGCLLALVREALGDHVWLPTCLDAEDEAWVVDSPSRNRQTRHESYAAALVAALEAAP